MPAASVAFADCSEIRKLARRLLRPGVRSHGDLVAERGLRQAHVIRAFWQQVVGDELVVALGRLVGNVERDHSSLAMSAFADQFDRRAVSRHDWFESFLHKGLCQNIVQAHLRQQRDEALNKGAVRSALDHHREFHGGVTHLYGGFCALILCPIDDVGPVDQLRQRRNIHAKLRAGDVRNPSRAARIARIEKLAHRL